MGYKQTSQLMNRDLQNMRQNYQYGALEIGAMAAQPVEQFRLWMAQAMESDIYEPNAMILATCGADNCPSARIVLIKEIDDDGIVFYTNYTSDKALDIEENPNVGATFYWDKLERQVRIEGVATKVPRARTNAYFASRPYDSRIGAYVSDQSAIIPDRHMLEDRVIQLEKLYPKDTAFEAPAYWGGYKIKVTAIEFWQGRPNRLHDRIKYLPTSVGTWEKVRLAP